MSLFGSVEKGGLREKLVVAFSLMSIIPILIIVYFAFNYVFPGISEGSAQLWAIVILTFWISWLGYLLISKTVKPIITMAKEARLIADGEIDKKVSIKSTDELGDLADSVNIMSDKIKTYMYQLQDYNQKTEHLKRQIKGKVRMMTELVRIEEMISVGTPFKEVVSFAAEKIADEVEKSFCAIILKDDGDAVEVPGFSNHTGRSITAEDLRVQVDALEKHFGHNEYLLASPGSSSRSWAKDVGGVFLDATMLLFPMRVKMENKGYIVCGNFVKGAEFEEDTIGLISVFAKSLLLGYQSSEVSNKIKSLEAIDPLTGLYTKAYLEERIQDEIDRSAFYQRPCSIIAIKVDKLEDYASRSGDSEAKKIVKRVSHIISGKLPQVGKAGRFGKDEFVILLPEMNKRESRDLAETFRKEVDQKDLSNAADIPITVSVGVGENPIDGVTATEITGKAFRNMSKAEKSGNLVVAD